ncbi:hypothetical protein CH373_01780 [Leptospira perolatii]|uniref:Uncharacterized protein n=2 Tax=Leptospira perolatii TaxID=2023191 RepID=A0A2M9ZRV6_9LEPT|nr:hypothetical protein CH360_01780 [Leptospira perolatii]PJZ74796.1 hypothetical protein CH373_01780 [Leptospira perolatii]
MLLSIPFFSDAWKELVFFQPIEILSTKHRSWKIFLSEKLFRSHSEQFSELGLRIEYILRKSPNQADKTETAKLAKELIQSGYRFVRIYDESYRLIFSSEPNQTVFQPDLRLGGLEIKPSDWAKDSQGDLLYRSSSGNLYFNLSQEDANRMLEEASGIKPSFPPIESPNEVFYFVFSEIGKHRKLSETNLSYHSEIVPGKSRSEILPGKNKEEESEQLYTILEKASHSDFGMYRSIWERTQRENTSIFLKLPRDSRALEMLKILSALVVSCLSLLIGILASLLVFSIRSEMRFSEREDWVKLKIDLLNLLKKAKG